MHPAYAPLLLGSGERLFDDLDDLPSGYEIADFVGTPAALHVRVARKPDCQFASGIGAFKKDVIMGSSRSMRFTTVT